LQAPKQKRKRKRKKIPCKNETDGTLPKNKLPVLYCGGNSISPVGKSHSIPGMK
jgi:hypothetical protein